MTYACPKCLSNDLQVRVETWAKLVQKDGETETFDLDMGHEWDGNSAMFCRPCGHEGIAEEFQQEEPCASTPTA